MHSHIYFKYSLMVQMCFIITCVGSILLLFFSYFCIQKTNDHVEYMDYVINTYMHIGI